MNTDTFPFLQPRRIPAGLRFSAAGLCCLAFCLSGVLEGAVVINEIHYNGEPNTALNEFVELYNTGEGTVDVSGWAFVAGIRYTFPAGTVIPAGGYVVVAQRPESILAEFGVVASGPYESNLSGDGERLALANASGTVVDEVTYSPAFPWPVGADGTGASMELINPSLDNDLGGSWRSSVAAPTPGARNSVYADNAPPQIRQVQHDPQQPKSGEDIFISARVTDPDGVMAVTLQYQLVAPGAYVPALLARSISSVVADPHTARVANPAYENGWITVSMLDNGAGGDKVAGDGTYTAMLPPQGHRTLVRYRITVADTLSNSVRVPYADDDALNFACFVYNGVPDYVAGTRSVLGAAPQVHPAAAVESIPVYHLLTTDADFNQAVAYNFSNQIPRENYDARRFYNWSGTFVYDGQVYDNIEYRLRQRNARYQGSGKRSFKFNFNRGWYPRFRDMYGELYPTAWHQLSSHKTVGSRENPTWGMDQLTNHLLWNLTGTPASSTHWFNMRVIKQADEAPSGTNGQYFGDFYGILLAMEEYDARFLDAHDLEKGNIYKLMSHLTDGVSVRDYQAAYGVDDGSDFQNIIFNLRRSQSDAWLTQHVNYEQWYRYHALCEAIRHYDFAPNTGEHLKNRAYYFEPTENSPFGRLWTLPWDSDSSWGPSHNSGIDFKHQAIFSGTPRTAFVREYMNVVRELRDLLWTEEQIGILLDHLASFIAPFVPADRDRWTNAPSAAGSQSSPTLESVVTDMKRFAFIGGSWGGGNESSNPQARDSGISGQQGRDAYLDALCFDAQIPSRPLITALGADHFPAGDLRFETNPYSGTHAFSAWKWRLAEVTLPDELPLPPGQMPKLEIVANWESAEITDSNLRQVSIPVSAVTVGRTYRVRVRTQDQTGRWSQWSEAIQFVAQAGNPDNPLETSLVISEFTYHPSAFDGFPHQDLEYVELMNIGSTELDLTGVAFTQGIQFNFPDDMLLAPCARILVVKNITAFTHRYGSGLPVAGEFSGQLDNAGEELILRAGEVIILRFTYSDDAPWPEAADGDGPSLVLINPYARPDHSVASNWRASHRDGGSPGQPDGLRSAYQEWALLHPEAEDPEEDTDGDGYSNLLEFAFGTDLMQPTGEIVQAGIRQTGTDGDSSSYLTLTFKRQAAMTDDEYFVEFTNDLSDWIVPGVRIENEYNADGTFTESWRSADSIESAENLLGRVRIVPL